MTVSTNSEGMPSFTVISNNFIDNYMASANGEYVKVYLYVLRAGGNVSCEEIADALEMTATDATRAVNYWSRHGLLSIREEEPKAAGNATNGPQALPEETLLESQRSQAEPQKPQIEPQKAQALSEKTQTEHENTRIEPEGSYTPDLEKLQADEDFSGLLYCLQRYMGRTFGQKDIESVGYMYDGLHMGSDMIEYLAEICVKRGRTSTRYMEAIARDWADKGITSVEAAKAETSEYSSHVWTVMKAFGLNDRKPAQIEQEYVEKWFEAYAFSEDLVKEAISRTMEAIHKPSFQYADSILEKWNAAGVHRLEEVKALDREHEKRSRAQTATGYTKPKGTGFSNFEQRDSDLESNMLAMLKDKL